MAKSRIPGDQRKKELRSQALNKRGRITIFEYWIFAFDVGIVLTKRFLIAQCCLLCRPLVMVVIISDWRDIRVRSG